MTHNILTPKNRFVRPVGVLAMGLLVVSVTFCLAADFQAETGDAEEQVASETGERLREGTKIEQQIGHFKISGDRATFHTLDERTHFIALENLNLQRIVRALGDSPDKVELKWSVSGVITEYREENYLLITRAILKTRGSQAETARPFGSANR